MVVLASIATVMEPISPIGEPNSVASAYFQNKNKTCHCNDIEKKNAPCEDRTHDLQIMRLTRCLLRQGSTHTLTNKERLSTPYEI